MPAWLKAAALIVSGLAMIPLGALVTFYMLFPKIGGEKQLNGLWALIQSIGHAFNAWPGTVLWPLAGSLVGLIFLVKGMAQVSRMGPFS